MVWASEIQGISPAKGYLDKLVHCLCCEYCFQVPANRIGHYQFSAAQLKTIQEVITLVVFCIFSLVYLKEELRWNYLVGFSMMVGAVFFIFKKW